MMNIRTMLEELVIFARERGGDDFAETRRVIQAAERRLELMAEAGLRLKRRSKRPECYRCGRGSTTGILCQVCLAEAPASIRNAFRNASGLNAIRQAARRVRLWANSQSERKAA